MNAFLTNDHFARLSPDRTPEPCGFEEWDACLNDPACSPYLVRERLDKWQVDLVFTGFWIGEGRPKFFHWRPIGAQNNPCAPGLKRVGGRLLAEWV